VITNVSEDHIGQDGIESVEDLIRIKSLVAERIRAGGTLILNADDPSTPQILKREAVERIEKTIVYFSLDETNPRVRDHLAAGGTVYFAKDNWLIEANGTEQYRLVEIDSIPRR
jgi:cyanophycin synthetase